uniref:Uncharacterized protein n=1 Tax=Ditylenchus dipsaci TaxID=166011 RepID=A0A915CU34_9BILA
MRKLYLLLLKKSKILLSGASKRYNYNFVLYQPKIAPRYVTLFVEDDTDAPATRIGWIRFEENHFDVVHFGIKEIKINL